MGSNTSKPSNDAAVHVQKENLDSCANSDPRSPTPEIVRTPLQSKNGGKHNITKNADLRKTFESTKNGEKLIHNNPILSAVIKNHLQSYDPRSPTQDFERTPIVIGLQNNDSQIEEKKLLRTQNDGSPYLKNDDANYDSCAEAQESLDLMPKNLCNGFLEMTLNDTIKETEEPLGSSTVSNEAIESNISSENPGKPSQLLETNFDFVESDDINKSEDSNEVKFDETEDSVQNIPLFKILDEDPRSPSTGIERTPIVVAKIETENNERNVEEMSDDTLIKVLQNTNTVLRQNVTKDVPDGLMIYEDHANDLNDTPKKSISTNNGARTPLSCMKNKTETGHTRSKSANTLLDPNGHKLIATKVCKRVSHIPRLKSLSKPSKLNQNGSSVSLKNVSKTSVCSGDYENTPPHSHRDKWDKESSIVL